MTRLLAALGGSIQRETAPQGTLSLAVHRPPPSVLTDEGKVSWRTLLGNVLPSRHLSREVNLWRLRNLPNISRGFWKIAAAELVGAQAAVGILWLTKIDEHGNRTPLGIASTRVVTTAGAGFLVDAFQGLATLSNLKFHGFGTGGSAEAIGNTALTTELTTQYASDNVRPTGSQTEASAVIYRSVATLSPDSTVSITEHGLFDQAAVAGGTLWDRTLFTAVPLTGSADSLQATYDLTITAGS